MEQRSEDRSFEHTAAAAASVARRADTRNGRNRVLYPEPIRLGPENSAGRMAGYSICRNR